MTSLNLVYFSSKFNFVFISYISYSSFDYKFNYLCSYESLVSLKMKNKDTRFMLHTHFIYKNT